tara:strand:+ start:51 stop:632 length:582 start_codon:yes stop_codon:yes gene_type:complete
MKTTFKITFDRPRRVSGDKVITPTTTVWLQSKEQAQELLIRLINKQEDTFDIIKNVRMKTFMGIKITDDNIIIPNNEMSDEDIVSFAKFRKQHWTKLNLSRGEWFMCNTRAFAKIVLDLNLHSFNKNPIINVDKTIERFTKEVKVTVNKKTVKKRIWFTDFLKGNRKKLPQSIFKFNKLLPLIEWAEEIKMEL